MTKGSNDEGEWADGSGASMALKALVNGPNSGPTRERLCTHFRDFAQAAVSELFFTIKTWESEDRQNTKVVALRVFFPTIYSTQNSVSAKLWSKYQTGVKMFKSRFFAHLSFYCAILQFKLPHFLENDHCHLKRWIHGRVTKWGVHNEPSSGKRKREEIKY